MNLDAIINIISFVVGLTIGLVQLYIAQHQFEVQQREKMDELRKTLTDILQKVAVLEATNSSRAFDIQDKMLQMAAGKAAVSEFTEETVGKLKELVTNELYASGVPENIEQLKRLQMEVQEIVESSVKKNLEGKVDKFGYEIMGLLSYDSTDQDISLETGLSLKETKTFINALISRFNLQTREELVNLCKEAYRGHYLGK